MARMLTSPSLAAVQPAPLIWRSSAGRGFRDLDRVLDGFFERDFRVPSAVWVRPEEGVSKNSFLH